MAGLGFAVLDRGSVLMGLCRSVVDWGAALAALVSRKINLVARIDDIFIILIELLLIEELFSRQCREVNRTK